MDDVAFCVQKDVPIVSGVGVGMGVSEKRKEREAVSDRGGSLKLQRTGHTTPTCFLLPVTLAPPPRA